MKVADIVRAVEALAPPELAADWDNVGLLVGDAGLTVRKAIVCVDVTEAVVAEAVRARAQMIVAHHPVIFRPVNRVTAGDSPTVYGAIRQGLAVYAAHTNLDAAAGGTNDVLADVLDLSDRRPLEPTSLEDRCKIVAFVPADDLSDVASAAFDAGAGRIGNYSECAFFCHGIGSFCGEEGARPSVGQAGRREVIEEMRLEVICPRSKAAAVRAAIVAAHSYEEPAIDTYRIENVPPGCGLGRIGRLKRPVTVQTVINRLKKGMGVGKVLLAAPGGRDADGRGTIVTTAACCTGSSESLFARAIRQGATLFVTGELGHHGAMDAVAAGMTVVCLGHGHSERLAMVRLGERLAGMLPKVTVQAAEKDVDPYTVV
jgi:dinuclear metal center YbgI/SA1388 family protein